MTEWALPEEEALVNLKSSMDEKDEKSVNNTLLDYMKTKFLQLFSPWLQASATQGQR